MFRSFSPQLRDIMTHCRNKSQLGSQGKHIQFWHQGGLMELMCFEMFWAFALELRGYDVEFVICDGCSGACLKYGDVHPPMPMSIWKKQCEVCIANHKSLLDFYGFRYTWLGDLTTQEEKDEIRKIAQNLSYADLKKLTFHGLAVGLDAQSGLLRYYKNVEPKDYDRSIVNAYVQATMVNGLSALHLVERKDVYRAFMSHCVYSDFGSATKAFITRGVPVINYVSSQIAGKMRMKVIDDTKSIAPFEVADDVWQQLIALSLNKEEESALDRLFYERNVGQQHDDIKNYVNPLAKDFSQVQAQFAQGDYKKLFGIFCQMRWDVSGEYNREIFNSHDMWLDETIRAASQNKHVKWIIRIHPADKIYGGETSVQHYIRHHYPRLPDNIELMTMEDGLASYDFFRVIDGAVTIGGTSGLECALLGKPVITAAEGAYAHKGFTIDAVSHGQYRENLRNAHECVGLSDAQVHLARVYAYSYFERSCIPINDFFSHTEWDLLAPESIMYAMPGASNIVDSVCDAMSNVGIIFHSE